MNLTIDMWSSNARHWEKILAPYKDKPITYLEIGSYEGASLCWVMENIATHPDSRAIAVDTWDVVPDWTEHTAEQWRAVFDRWKANTAPWRGRIVALRGDSAVQLALVQSTGWDLDVAYIDGSHRALACLTDMCLAWRLLKPGGTMIVDDVLYWSAPDTWEPHDSPATACDAFALIVGREGRMHGGQMVWVK